LPTIVIVGGGIGGLYAAYLLGKAGYPLTVLEQGDRWGGRIESVMLPPGSDSPFIAEFGPMRFEPGLQERLVALANDLGLAFTPFAPTTAPANPTDYELSDIEASFSTTSQLLMWAVLKMFFGDPSPEAVAAVPDAASLTSGEAELAALRATADAYLDGDYDAVQSRLDALRTGRRLCAGTDESAPLLRDLGLWNALAEIVSPGALAKIRDSGTFYHFIPHNPSAVEWGIFWLRQASTRGASIETFAREHAPAGVATLVDRLRERIEQTCPSVHLVLQQRVLDIVHGKHPAEVELIVDDNADGTTYNLLADHVILALPQASLRNLSTSFPDQVRLDVEGVMPLPLLKAFIVTNRPWWPHHLNAQSHAWLVPTRELHYLHSAR
jgi:phytoene dehydrogenase-like protein